MSKTSRIIAPRFKKNKVKTYQDYLDEEVAKGNEAAKDFKRSRYYKADLSKYDL